MSDYRADEFALRAGVIIAGMRDFPGMYTNTAAEFACFAHGVFAMAALPGERATDAWVRALRDVLAYDKNVEPKWNSLGFDRAIAVILAAAERMRIAVPPPVIGSPT